MFQKRCAEFAASKHINASTDVTPFFADYGYHPHTGIEPPGTYEGERKAELLAADEIVLSKIRSILPQQSNSFSCLLSSELSHFQIHDADCLQKSSLASFRNGSSSDSRGRSPFKYLLEQFHTRIVWSRHKKTETY